MARSIDMHPKHLMETIARAHAHKGTAFVEIYQNCNIFNDGAFGYAQDRALRADNVIELKHGEPMIYGKNLDKGIVMVGRELKSVVIGENGITKDDLLVHDEKADVGSHFLLARMRHPDLPEPIGVLRCVQRPTYDEMVNEQIRTVVEKKGTGNLQKLLNGSSTWTVPAEA